MEGSGFNSRVGLVRGGGKSKREKKEQKGLETATGIAKMIRKGTIPGFKQKIEGKRRTRERGKEG